MQLAITDDLTGLANRREFSRVIEASFTLARARGLSLSLILPGIDRFKDFNGTFGHPAGDTVLRTLAESLNLARTDPLGAVTPPPTGIETTIRGSNPG